MSKIKFIYTKSVNCTDKRVSNQKNKRSEKKTEL